MPQNDITYNFGQNANSLDDVNQRLNDITEVKQDIASIFQALGSVYEGDGAAALQQAHQKIDSMLEEALNTTANTQKQAQDQQDAMQALDRANSAAF